jgi:hypothetical protein
MAVGDIETPVGNTVVATVPNEAAGAVELELELVELFELQPDAIAATQIDAPIAIILLFIIALLECR